MGVTEAFYSVMISAAGVGEGTIMIRPGALNDTLGSVYEVVSGLFLRGSMAREIGSDLKSRVIVASPKVAKVAKENQPHIVVRLIVVKVVAKFCPTKRAQS